MRKFMIVFVLFCSFLAPPQLLAWDDLCDVGAKLFWMTDVQVREYYRDRLENRTVKGTGAVLDVVGGPYSSQYAVIVDCGNGIIANVKSDSMGLKDLNLQQSVKFSGTLSRVEKFQDAISGKPYVSFTLNNASVSKY